MKWKKRKQAETIPLTLYRVSDLKFSMSGKERHKIIENFCLLHNLEGRMKGQIWNLLSSIAIKYIQKNFLKE